MKLSHPNLLRQIQSFVTTVNIERRTGKFAPLLEVNLKNGRYILDGKQVNYSFGSLHKVFIRALSHYQIKKRPIKSVLILGFGVGSVASILKRGYNMNCSITGVEIDPIVLELGRKYFNLDQIPDLKLICQDAYEYVKTESSIYDLIIIDVFIEDHVPLKFHKPEFLKVIKGLLNSGGILIFNKVTETNTQKREALELADTISNLFGKVEVLKMTIESVENSVIVYSDNSCKNANFTYPSLVRMEKWSKKINNELNKPKL